jgi:putative FmdB family regulatory protein
MPLYDYLCLDCAEISELLVTGSNEKPVCCACGSSNLKKMLSAHSSLSGTRAASFPGPGDTSCCGSMPAHAGCAGPGSCCGKGPHH